MLIVLLLVPRHARSAEEPTDQDSFAQGVVALKDGAHDRAIAVFEALADRGFDHPDAAFNRGLAYLARTRAHIEQPGDLGRAAAAFEECLEMRPNDTQAEQALDLVREEVARRRAQRGGSTQVQARPALHRAVAGLMTEKVWAMGALVSSLVLTVGLILRQFSKPAVHLAGLIAGPLGLIFLALFGSFTWLARHLRLTTAPAVVVASEARILDERGSALNTEPIPEAARVEILDRRGELVAIRYGTREGWTHRASLRALSRRP